MSVTNLGRVQGGSVFYTTNTSGAIVPASTLTPNNIVALVGDMILFPNGDLRKVTAGGGDTILCGDVLTNLKGPQGEKGDTGASASVSLYKHEVHIYKNSASRDDGQFLLKLEIYKTTPTAVTYNDIITLATTDYSNGKIAGGIGYPIKYKIVSSQTSYINLLTNNADFVDSYLAHEDNHPSSISWEDASGDDFTFIECLDGGYQAMVAYGCCDSAGEVTIYDYVTQIS